MRAGAHLFFFFQAEDGIRDYKVTGVQTCALPILPRRRGCGRPWARSAPQWRRRPRAAVRAMIDRLVLVYFVHTPEVPAELKDAAVATARRRYTNRRAVDDMVRAGSVSSPAPGAGTRADTQ